jgi:hypothetical protein
MKLLNTAFLILSLLSGFTISQANNMLAVDFGANYGANNNTAALPWQSIDGDFNFNGSSTDRARHVPLGQEFTSPNSANWTTPEGKSGAVIRYGISVANIGSSLDASGNLVRYNGTPNTLQNSSGTTNTTNAMRMASAWYWEKPSFLNSMDAASSLSLANIATSVTAGFLNSGSGVTHARALIRDDSDWYISGELFAGTTGTLSFNAAATSWHAFDPTTASLLFYDSTNLGVGVLGSTFANVTAIGVHVQSELFDGSGNHAVQHQLQTLEVAVIPEPGIVASVLGLAGLLVVLFRRRKACVA